MMRLDSFDLNLLVALDALLRRRSVTDAAEELRMTQSAMSSALKRARQHFDDEIIYYDGQKMVPTPFGMTIDAQLPEMLAQLRNLAGMRATTDLADLKREFTIIASDYVCAVFLSRLSRHLSRAAPDVSISVLPFTQESFGRFQRGSVDFVIAPDFGFDATMEAAHLFSDTFSVVFCANHPKAASGLSKADFLSLPHVVTHFQREGGMSHLERYFHTRNVQLTIAAALSGFVSLPFYLAGTRNLATVHNRLLAELGMSKKLKRQDTPIEIPPLEEYLVTPRKHRHDAEAQIIAKEMLAIGADLQNSA